MVANAMWWLGNASSKLDFNAAAVDAVIRAVLGFLVFVWAWGWTEKQHVTNDYDEFVCFHVYTHSAKSRINKWTKHDHTLIEVVENHILYRTKA